MEILHHYPTINVFIFLNQLEIINSNMFFPVDNFEKQIP